MARKSKAKEKREIEKTLNELFGTNIRWSKLSHADLTEFVNSLLSKKFCRKVCGGNQNVFHGLVKMIDKLIPPEEQGPIIRALKSLSGMTDES